MSLSPMKTHSLVRSSSILAMSSLFSIFSCIMSAHAEPAGMTPSSQSPGVQLSFMTTGAAHAKPTKLTIELIAQKETTSPTSAQLKLNQLVDDAVKMLSEESDIKTTIGNYSISQQYTQKGPSKWNAQQNIKISGTDSKKLLSYAEKLQKTGLNIDNFIWSLDSQTRHTLEQKARKEALQKVRKQAESDADDLGLKFVKLEKITVHTPDMPNHMVPRAMTMMLSRSAEASPQSTPEDQSVVVTVMAKAQLDNK